MRKNNQLKINKDEKSMPYEVAWYSSVRTFREEITTEDLIQYCSILREQYKNWIVVDDYSTTI